MLTTFLLLVLIAPLVLSQTVQTTSGPVTGFAAATGVNAFLGIPYATPPVGNLRWTAPTPPTPWTSSFSATQFGNTCIQNSASTVVLTSGPAQTFSEDCLTINVWAPSSGGNHSVLVWIHGGFLIMGGSGETQYNGANFASQGVVLVSFNYRLGNLGFLALNELSGPANGAFGFLDQQLALKWVNENIAAFGGNPSQVTIFGESAGCGSVSLHVTLPSSWPYFQQAILESCPAFAEANAINYQIEAGEATVTVNKCTNSDASSVLSCMRSLSPTTFALSLSDPLPMIAAGSGQTVDKTQYQAIQIGRIHPGAILGGDVNNEGTIFVYGYFTSAMSSSKYQSDFPAFLYASMGISDTDAAAMINQYPCSSYTPSDCRVAASALYGDLRYRCPTNTFIQASNNVTYAYTFTEVPSYGLSTLGSYHGSELPFVFGTLSSVHSTATPAETQLATNVNLAWVSFASTGTPAVSGQPTWPVYSSPSYQRMVINTGTWTTGSTADCSFFTPYYKNYYTNGIPYMSSGAHLSINAFTLLFVLLPFLLKL